MKYKLDKSSHAVFSLQYLRKEFPKLKELLWPIRSGLVLIFLASTGQVSLDVLKKYVEEQQSDEPKV